MQKPSDAAERGVVPIDDVVELWTALLSAHRRLTSLLDGELRRGADMTLDEYDVLYQLRSAAQAMRMSDLADRVLISRASTTRVVDRLVRREWVRRWHDEADRRVVLASLTDAGRRAQRKAGRLHLEGIARLVGRPLQGRDIAELAAALRALGDGAAEM